MRFDRLDEAQAIKNHKSHTSIACRGLIATHRWAISGTPIQNAPRELFPYFKFLRVEHTGTYKIFCQNFIGTHSDGSMNKVGLDRLHSFLSRFMIRRTHADQLMGAPIVSLPKASERIYWCQFNDLERAIYEMVRARMIQRINRLSRSRQLENNYSNILTMLLRLRQLTGHLLALEQPMKDLLEKEDHEKIYDLAKEANTNHRSGHKDKMRGLREELYRPGDEHDKGKRSVGMPGVRNEENENAKDKDNDRADSINGSAARKDYANTGRHHGSKFDFLMYLQDLKDGIAGKNSDQRSACAFCNDIAEEPWKTQCYHVYCRRCLERMAEEAALRDQGGARCVVCHTVYTSTAPCDRMNFDHNNGEYDDDSNVDDESDQELLRKTTKQGRKKNTAAEKSKDWIDLAEGNDILPSSKTLAIKAQIINWLEEDPSMKIIIYTQFIDMIRILSKVCNAEKWKHSLYHGGKSYEARDEAIREFSENPNMRIMIASLRCGGVGLNLTMAQKVIVVDPWWNSSVEQQAFCRVFRIGQTSETSMTRFVVEKTIDENMIRMQERKQKEIDIVMDNDKHCK
jgi:SNF2 family DNA or RNA helicase